MEALRTPGSGCPWDLEQTFSTIAPYTIEEAYEVADAIARANMADLKDELGDLLLQVVYHSRMAEEAGAFQFADVADAIVRKMVRRHPHVFGDDAQRQAGVEDGFWERIKAEERAAKSEAHTQDATQPERMLDGVPLALPALTRAIKLQNKAAKVGFDWPSLAPVLAKMQEELAELEAALAAHQESDASGAPTRPSASIEEEFGDLLFVIANVARHLKLDPEAALRAANQKFIARFEFIEDQLHTT
ncbi:MAG: nucleoside triphosphate pyrophosphohydrolase, partial [Alphaproteobacteria bacterium]|nr:nucleoside triphosphate pyrophosphohydrolase [Alphaproteobacteria bacterium]